MKKVNEMSRDERIIHWATAPRATVGTIGKLIDRDIRTYFVGKLRGKIVSRIGDGEYKFNTAKEAMDCARSFRAHSLKLAKEMNLPINDNVTNAVRAFKFRAHGTAGIVYTTTASKARYCAVRCANDAGYKTAFADVSVQRASEYDGRKTDEGKIPQTGTCWKPELLVRN